MHPTEQQVKEAFNRAPKAVQDALSDGPVVDFIFGLQERYSLHVDVSGAVIERIRDLLLGLSNPTEFLGELVTLGITDTVARTIVADLNKEVFIPLSEQIRTEAAKLKEPEPKKPLPPPALEYAPAAPATLPGSTEAAPMPMVQAPAPLPATIPGAQAHPAGWHPAAAVHIYVPQGANHAQEHQAIVSALAPAAPPPAPIETVVRPVPQPPKPQAAPAAPAAEPRPYASDPYREPI